MTLLPCVVEYSGCSVTLGLCDNSRFAVFKEPLCFSGITCQMVGSRRGTHLELLRLHVIVRVARDRSVVTKGVGLRVLTRGEHVARE
jgi:hypothetical protein